MKLLSKSIKLTSIMLMIFILSSTIQINALESINTNISYRKVSNIAVLFYSLNDPYILEVKQSLEDIQKENEDKVNFTFYDGNNNISKQTETLDFLLKDNIDLFIFNLADSRQDIVEDVIYKIKAQNVPAIFLGISPEIVSKVSKDYEKAFFMGSRAPEEGNLQGEILVDLWNTNKSVIDKNGDNILKYILVTGEIDNPIAIRRTKDVISTINNSGIKTQELQRVNANWFRELSKISIQNLFLKYDGKIEAIIANNDTMAIGAIEALQTYGYNKGDKSKYIPVVGIDGLKEARELIDKGVMTGTVFQDPKIIAKAEYNVAMNIINNESPINNTNYTLNNGLILYPLSVKKYTSVNFFKFVK